MSRSFAYKKEIFQISFLIILINITLSVIYELLVDDANYIYPSVTFLSFFLQGVFVPFFEETLMRGIIQKGLVKKTNLPLPVIYIIVASIFSMLHMEIFFIPYFITSLLLSYTFQKTNKLLVPIICHMNYNIFVLLLCIFKI